MNARLLGTLGLAILPAIVPVSAGAEALRIALASEPTAADPHYHNVSPNNALGKYIFDALAATNADQKAVPGLASSWQAVDDTTWVFKLRSGVKFTNGDPFDVNDVIFTFCRVMNNPQSVAGSFTPYVTAFAKVETPDNLTLKITTKTPDPLIPEKLAEIAILSDSIVPHGEITFDLEKKCGVTGEWPTLAQLNSGEATIGTGPFKLVKYVKGAGVELVRNDGYWGEKPAWDKVSLLPVPNAGPRLAGLLAGDYDLIESPSARDANNLKKDPKFSITTKPSNRVIFLQFDIERDKSPFVETADGKNPFKDERVRRAVSLAIDRNVIVKRIMDDAAAPASQFVPETMFGAQPKPEPLVYDPKKAKELLAEAGYPNGFKLTLHATNDRYINDGQVAQAIAQFLNRVGIQTEVDAMTSSIFFSRRSKREFSLSQGGWGSSFGGASNFLTQFVATNNKNLGTGRSNYGGWSDPEFDAVISQANATIDEKKRSELLQQAARMALKSLPDIPIHFESTIWAFRKGLSYEGRMDQYTLAAAVKPAR